MPQPQISLPQPCRKDDLDVVDIFALGPKLSFLAKTSHCQLQPSLQNVSIPRNPGWESNSEADFIPRVPADDSPHPPVVAAELLDDRPIGREALHSLEEVLSASGRSRGFEAIKLKQPDGVPESLESIDIHGSGSVPSPIQDIGCEAAAVQDIDAQTDIQNMCSLESFIGDSLVEVGSSGDVSAEPDADHVCSVDDYAPSSSLEAFPAAVFEENRVETPVWIERVETPQTGESADIVSSLKEHSRKREDELFSAVAQDLVLSSFFPDGEEADCETRALESQALEGEESEEDPMGEAWYFSSYAAPAQTQACTMPPQLEEHIKQVLKDVHAALELADISKCTAALWELSNLYSKSLQSEEDCATSWSNSAAEIVMVVNTCLKHEDLAVKRAAFQTRSTIDLKEFEDKSETLRTWVFSEHEHTRKMAFDCFAELETSVLLEAGTEMTHGTSKIVSLLLEASVADEREPRSDRPVESDDDLHTMATTMLNSLNATAVGLCLSDVVLCLESKRPSVLKAALEALSRLSPEAVSDHIPAVALRLRDEDDGVRLAALSFFEKLPASTLACWVSSVASRLRDSQLAMQLLAATVLAGLQQEDFAQHQKTFRKQLGGGNTLLHFAARHGRVQLLQTLATRHRPYVLHAQNNNGDTALHVAARNGHLNACQILVRLGSLCQLENSDSHTALQIAEQRDHRLVANDLRGLQAVSVVHGGAGDVLSLAMTDCRPVLGVEWYTVPLQGVAGLAGAVHSLLAITVGADSESQDTYVLEKAQQIRSNDEQPQPCANDVYISRWADIMPNITSAPLHCLGSADLENRTGEALSIGALRTLSVNLGAYNTATCNCHHAAQAVYNACARKSAQVSRLPNAELMMVPWLLNATGLNFGAGALTIVR